MIREFMKSGETGPAVVAVFLALSGQSARLFHFGWRSEDNQNWHCFA
jgi:hypothetical protein